jgi:hypothetical protein
MCRWRRGRVHTPPVRVCQGARGVIGGQPGGHRVVVHAQGVRLDLFRGQFGGRLPGQCGAVLVGGELGGQLGACPHPFLDLTAIIDSKSMKTSSNVPESDQGVDMGKEVKGGKGASRSMYWDCFSS